MAKYKKPNGKAETREAAFTAEPTMIENTPNDSHTTDEREQAAPVADEHAHVVTPPLEVTPAAPVTEPVMEDPLTPTPDPVVEDALAPTLEPVAETVAESQPEPASVPEPTPETVAAPVAVSKPEAAPEQVPVAEPEAEKPKPAKKPRAPKTPKADAEPQQSDSPAEPATEAKPENKKKWYAVKVQSNREDTIKAAIIRKVAIEGLEEYFGQIVVPVEEVIEKKQVRVKDKKTGEYSYQEKKVTKKKKKFHGYIFAEVEFNDRILYLFRETSGVGDFLNVRGTPPVAEPMAEHEVQQMLTGERGKGGPGGPKKIKLEFEKGDRVRIKEGSFANSEGEVKAISEPKDPTDPPKITVVVTFWGRPLDVELDWYQVVKA